jgi:hypothetical protein
MKTLILSLLAGISLIGLVGCESVHEGVRDTTRPVGSVSRLPNSAMEGAAQGVAGQPTANPYGR